MPTAGAFSDFVEDAIAKQYFRNTAPAAPPATVYVAAFTAVPTDVAGSGTEVSAAGTAYARQAVSCGTSGTGVGAGWTYTTATGTVVNAADVLWAICTASWGTVVAFGIFDAVTGGNMIARIDKDGANAAISVAITTVGVDQLKIPAGSLSIVID